jgi:hypothetical protein
VGAGIRDFHAGDPSLMIIVKDDAFGDLRDFP